MEQEIRFCELNGHRIAYATVGEGPPLVFGGRWISHLEEEWADPLARSFFEELAENHRVVRYDRFGRRSLRSRSGPRRPARRRRAAARRRHRRVRRRAGDDLRVLLLRARDGPLRERRARPRRAVVFFGAYAARDDIPDGDPALGRRSHARQLAARLADDRRPARSARRAGTRSPRSAATCASPPRRTSPPPSSSSTSRPTRARSSHGSRPRRSCSTAAPTAPSRSAVGGSSPRCCRTRAS